MMRIPGFVTLLLLVLALGCKKPAANAPTQASVPTPPGPQGPVETVETTLKAASNNQPVVIWQQLPGSYQKDVQDLVSEFANKMDPELWNQTFATARKAVDVSKKQKKLIIESIKAFVPPNVDMKQLEAQWDTVADLLLSVLDSDLAKLDNLKKPDIEKFLASTGANFMSKGLGVAKAVEDKSKPGDKIADFSDKLAKTKVTLVGTATADAAKVKVEAPGEKPEEIDLIKVDGKWIPKDVAKDWAKSIKEARAGLDQIKSDEIAKMKPHLLSMLKETDKKLDQLAAAKTSDEFQKIVGELVQTVMSPKKE